MQRGIKVAIIAAMICITILSTTYFWASKNYMIAGILMVMLTICPFIVRFERRRVQAEELVVLAVLIAIASIARVPFAALPSIQPTSFVVILSGIVFGPETGFLIGGMGAFVSNLFLGQGPWTPWQMFAWGLMGMIAGILRNTFIMKNSIARMTYGFIWGFLFGWIMNLWFLLNIGENITWQALIVGAATSAPMDLNHAICNVIFLAIFSKAWLKTLIRTKEKFDIF